MAWMRPISETQSILHWVVAHDRFPGFGRRLCNWPPTFVWRPFATGRLDADPKWKRCERCLKEME